MSDFERFEAMVTPEMIRAATEALGPCVGSCGEASPPDSYDIRCAIAAALAASPVPAGWLPIESAPKDGTEVWAFNGESGRMKWIDGDGYALWAWADELLSDVDPDPEQPTHYMPLPAAPSAPTMPNDLTESAASVSAPAQQAERECRHCGWLCRPNPAESQRWYPLTDPAPAPSVEAQAVELRTPLSEEHIGRLAKEAFDGYMCDQNDDPDIAFARAVEAAHGIAALKEHSNG